MRFLTYLGLILLVVAGILLVKVGVDRHLPTKTETNTVTSATVPEHCSLNSVPALVTKKVLSVQVPDDQVIVLAGEIAENAYAVADGIASLANNKKPIWLLINSPGGSVLDGALVISAMEAAGVPVYTVCMQLCASMAAVIHQHGTKRYMLDRSILMFHDAAGTYQGYMPHVRAQFDAVERYFNKMNYFIARRSGTDPDEWIATLHKNLWIDGEDSVNRHFADGLVFIKVLNTRGVVNMDSLIKPVKTNAFKVTPVPSNNPFKDLTL